MPRRWWAALWAFLALLVGLVWMSYADDPQNITAPLNIREEDASPDTFPWQLRVSNGTLTDNGDGTASLTTGGGSGTPGGSDTQAQYNNAGTFGGSSGLTLNATTITDLTFMAGAIASADLTTGLSDETGTGLAVFGTSPTLATPIETGKIDRNNVAVDDDDCTGEQGLWWYDTTDSVFEWCNANSGTPATLGGGSGTPGGADTNVQYNAAGSFGGDAGFTYNETPTAPVVTIADTTASALDLKIKVDGNKVYINEASQSDGNFITIPLTALSTQLQINANQSAAVTFIGADYFEMMGATEHLMALVSETNSDSERPKLQFFRSRGSNAAQTATQNTDRLGAIAFGGYDAGGFEANLAFITAIHDNTTGSNDLPTALQFSNAADGSNFDTVNMILGSDGALYLGASETAAARISQDGDGAVTIQGLGDGSDESITVNLDDTSNTAVWSSATGVTNFTYTSIGSTWGALVTANANLTVGNGATTAGVLTLLEDTDAGSNFASFQVPALVADTVYTLPPDDGDAGEQLQTNGSGTLTWEAAGSGGSVAGSNTQIQFNDSSAFGADAGLTYDKTNDLVVIGENGQSGTLSLYSENGATDHRVGVRTSSNTTATNFFIETSTNTAGNNQYFLTVDRSGLMTVTPGYSNLRIVPGGTTTTQVTITADYLTLRDPNEVPFQVSNVSLTASITTSGLNGLDTGAEGSSTWYYIWVIASPNGSVGSLLSTSATAPTMPATYLYKRRVGAVRNDGSSNFISAWQQNGRVIYETRVNVLTSGTATSFTDIDCSAMIPPTSRYGFFIQQWDGGASFEDVYVRPNGGADTTGQVVGWASTSEGAVSSFDMATDSAQIIEYRTSNGAAGANDPSIAVVGYRDAL